ncbi:MULTISPECIES: aldehyde dehydrogenase family protein [Acinetobacter]|uniref:Aldehyde dehydrogenase family protein n=1 Tax=Acinetobacter piscicola TaxID=2006115 RepID=A0A7S6VXJ7_9GAMM|nr:MULTISPECIES: aldehyde dehydrogenase family protein [Acinetobacter]QOW46693.1 aldehyde dehydrogenase family protein [Acinetobacter piscicola]
MNTDLLIHGERIQGAGEAVAVLNPATEDIITRVNSATAEQVQQAVNAAKTAFQIWKNTDDEELKANLLKIAAGIEAERDSLAALITQEQGKPLFLANAEVHLGLQWIQYIAQLDIPVEHYTEASGKQIQVFNRPLGVVASVTPWNWPFMIAIWHLLPALRTKNTVVIKPSEYTPLSTIRLVEIMNSVLPKGVCNIVLGKGDVGKLLTEHPDVNKVVFTGSTKTGKFILGSSVDTLKSVVLELGGNDVGIVLNDVNVDQVAEKLFQSSFLNAGQTCACLKRLYVHADIYDALTQKIAAIADQQTVGNGLDQQTSFGPVQNKMQYQKVKDLLADALDKGAKVLNVGAKHPEKGYFISPTVVVDIQDGVALVDDEQFGPVLPIVKYTDIEQVLRVTNQSEFGLGGSVWSNDLDKAQSIAARMQTGSVWVNSHGDLSPEAAFGGWKQSGLGYSFGLGGLLQFTHKQSIHVSKLG